MTKKEIFRKLCGYGINSLNRFPIFLDLAPQISGKKYWYALEYAYTSSDNLCEYRPESKLAFQSAEPGRETLMTAKDKKYLASLPDEIEIYRGMTRDEFKSGNFSISWSLNKNVAEYFAKNYNRNVNQHGMEKLVHTMKINKNQIIAYFSDRQESEVIIIL